MGLTARPDRVQFRDRHKGATIYVLGSGSSLNFIDPGYFADKIVVTTNHIGVELGLEEFYCVSHYHIDANLIAASHPHIPIIVPEVDQGGNQLAETAPEHPNVWAFPTNQQAYAAFDPASHWPGEDDSLVVGPTSLHMTMHFAHYLGARYIVLVGADCGILDGEENRTGHDRGIGSPWGVWAMALPRVAAHLRSLGTDVYSLNPFVNFGLEGHSYWSPTATVN
jgi:hypothetical protein